MPTGTPRGDGSLWEEQLFEWKADYSTWFKDLRDPSIPLRYDEPLDPRLVALDWNQTISFPKREWTWREDLAKHQLEEVSKVPDTHYDAIKRLLVNGFIVQVVSYIGKGGKDSDHRRAELPRALKKLNAQLLRDVGPLDQLPIHCRIVDNRNHKVPYCRSQGCHTLVDDNDGICGDARAAGFLVYECSKDRRTKGGLISSVRMLHTLPTAVEGIIDAREQGWHLNGEDRQSYSWRRKS